MSSETRTRRQVGFFTLILLTLAFAAAVLFGGFRPAIIELGSVRISALQPIFAGLGLPAIVLFGLPIRTIPTLCFAGAAIALIGVALWMLTASVGRQSAGHEILQVALAGCALGLAARGFAAARGLRRALVGHGT